MKHEKSCLKRLKNIAMTLVETKARGGLTMAKACWKQYTLYKGDMIIAEGTVKEIAQQTGLAVNTIKFYARPTHERRCKGNNHKMLVPLDVYSIGSADNGRKNK